MTENEGHIPNVSTYLWHTEKQNKGNNSETMTSSWPWVTKQKLSSSAGKEKEENGRQEAT